MTETGEWIGLADAVHRAGGLVTYWGLYQAALRSQVDSRRNGKHWQVRVRALDRYIAERQAKTVLDQSRESTVSVTG